MSRYQNSYDAGESRRSPRDQSPGRYNDTRDEFRGGGARGTERRRSIPDARMNHNSFASNRELFSTNRDTSRDFNNSSRDPPRGPKGFPDAPTGPRATSHSEFRGDFGGGYRGDFRGERGRGRGRGWRDDSRDRGRELDREYRDRRDDRGPPPSFRDDRGRDRWGTREPFRGRRASSPPGRGRSPNYGPRDSRDVPPNIEIDRTRRGSRDGPLSGGSPGSDSVPPFGRGYGRAPRGGRGRGRANFYEDGFHRPPGRSRSPEPLYRRTQPSATPPPQVPAFGSAAATPTLPIAPNTSITSTSTTDIAGPVPGVAVPTAPRAYGPANQTKQPSRNSSISSQWVNPAIDARKPKPNQPSVPPVAGQNQSSFALGPGSLGSQTAGQQSTTDTQRPEDVDAVVEKAAAPGSETRQQEKEDVPAPRRQGLIGKRGPEISIQEIPDAASESESEDEVNDAYFEDEITKIEAEITKVDIENPLDPNPESPAAFMKPFRQQMIDRIVENKKLLAVEPCVAPEVKVEEVHFEAPVPPVPASIPQSLEQPVAVPSETTPILSSAAIPDLPAKASRASRSRSSTPAIPPKSKASNRSRPSTPSLQPKEKQQVDSNTNGTVTPAPAPLSSARIPLPSVERAESIPREPITPLKSIEDSSNTHPDILAPEPRQQSAVNGVAQKRAPLDVPAESDGEMTEAENEEILEAVRPRMKTPPISSLPNFGNKKWFEDDHFLETLKPNPVVEARIKQKLMDDRAREEREQQDAREEWGQKYYEYRRFTDFADDPIAVRSRERFAKARAQAAAEAAAPHQSSVPSVGAKPEAGRRGRWATEHDFERVLRESELEAKETKENDDRVARAKTASAKEATIPDAAWDREEWKSMQHIDKTHLVPFERSFALLEFGEPIDNFTVEEAEIFERVYLEFPKQWSKIAAALPRRNYKSCIQHYYLIKHSSELKDKLKRQPKKRKARQPKAKNPKPNALSAADANSNRDEAEDGQDNEGGERRGRPRRAAAPTFNFEAAASESEVASPVPTPGRKAAATPKSNGDPSTEVPPPKRKTKATREKGTKQAKNSQLLAAAPPIAAAPQRADSPATPIVNTEWMNRRDIPGGSARFPNQYDGTGASQPPPFTPPFAPIERPNPSMPINFDPLPQHFSHPPMPIPQPQPPPPPPPATPQIQERMSSAPPTSFDGQQDRRAIQQTSSYWSVPEQTDFPALLRHFGTDWHGIAKWMTSKTHIMVKNYYQRQVDLGKKEWEIMAKDADEKRERNEPTGPLPTPTVIPKRRYDITPGSHPRSSSAMDQTEEFMSPGPNSVMSQVAPPQPPSLSARFPALAQAGPVPQVQPGASTSTLLNKHMPHQPIQQAPQQIQQQPRPSRGPVSGFFSNEPPSRPSLTNDNAISQRSVMVAQEAQIERQSALRLEREQREQQRQRELQQSEQEQAMLIERERHTSHQREIAMQQREQQALRERHLQMKQENETPNPNQYEPYQTPTPMAPANQPHTRAEPHKPPPQSEPRRTAPPQHHIQQYQPRANPNVRPFVGESVGSARDLKSTPSPAVPRPPMSAPPANQEMYSAPPQPPPHQVAPPLQPTPAAPRQPEPARKSNIMSLLNDDEPVESRPPAKRPSDVSNTSMQTTRTPPPQHSLHPSRYSAHPAQSTPQQHPHMPQQMTPQLQSQQQAPPQNNYSQPTQPQHPLHQHSSSIGHTRSYTPTATFDGRPTYAQPQMQQQQQQQQQHMYSQPRQSMTSQPSLLRREPSIGEMHGMAASGGYARSSTTPSQPHSRLKESPYSAPTPPPQAPQAGRQSMGSPHDLPLDQRDYYQRQPQPGYFIQAQQQQQQNAAASPQLGPSYNSPSQQHQQPPVNHRQLAFGNSPHVPSPPPQFNNHHSLHNSRHNSFDGREGRYQMGSSAPGPSPAPAPSHPGIYRPYTGVPEVRTQRNGERDIQPMRDQMRDFEAGARRDAQRRDLDRRDMEEHYRNQK